MSILLKSSNLTVYSLEITGYLVIDHSVRDLCTRPYPGHPKGCPYFGKRPQCPPAAPIVEEFIDITQPHYFLVAKYSLSSEKSNTHAWHSIQSVLTESVNLYENEHPGTVATLHPSAVGIDVYKTAEAAGITLQLPHTLCGVALIGYSL